jgi:hypothetical protein
VEQEELVQQQVLMVHQQLLLEVEVEVKHHHQVVQVELEVLEVVEMEHLLALL